MPIKRQAEAITSASWIFSSPATCPQMTLPPAMPPVKTIQKKASPRALTQPGRVIWAAVIRADAVIIHEIPIASMAQHAVMTLSLAASASIPTPYTADAQRMIVSRETSLDQARHQYRATDRPDPDTAEHKTIHVRAAL